VDCVVTRKDIQTTQQNNIKNYLPPTFMTACEIGFSEISIVKNKLQFSLHNKRLNDHLLIKEMV
jgi:hypothetical protein